MKTTVLCAVLLSINSAVSFAQVLSSSGQIIRSVPPVVERLPSNLSRLRQQTESQAKDILDDKANTARGLANQATNAAIPRFTVPDASTILSSNGQPAFQEINVEGGFLAIDKEWLILIDDNQIEHLTHASVALIEKQFMPSLSKWLFRIRIEGNEEEVSSFRNSLPAELRSQLSRNHVYLSQAKLQTAQEQSSANITLSTSANTRQLEKRFPCSEPLRMGMIDTEIDHEHSSFAHIDIVQQRFLKDDISSSNEHGTSVASIMAKALPKHSQLFNANVFYTRNSISRGATLSALLKAINYLATLEVDAINMSLAGPDNPLLRIAIGELDKAGIQVIAAVGNEGPASLPLYPAAYPQTLGATAVDDKNQIYRWANQGDYVDFAAPGVSIETAAPLNKFIRQTGTSMAAPLVSAKYACVLRTLKNRHHALEALKQKAIDVGQPGRDTVFGFGVLLR